MRIKIVTPYRKGGPYNWGLALSSELNKKGLHSNCINKLFDLFFISFFVDKETDLVHASVPIFFKLWKKPLILTVHGNYKEEKMVYRLLWFLAIKNAELVTVPSQFLKNKLRLERAVVIPNAIDSGKFKKAKYSERKDINVVTTTKFHFKNKAYGVLELIDLLQSIKTDKKINFYVLGDGKYLSDVKKLSNLCKPNITINFTGFIKPETILHKCDIFVYYSNLDNFPIAILEAMASGLPVVTNNVGAVTEMIKNGKSGYIGNKDEMRVALTRLINDSALREVIGKNGLCSVRAKYRWGEIIPVYTNLYKKMLNQSSSTRSLKCYVK